MFITLLQKTFLSVASYCILLYFVCQTFLAHLLLYKIQLRHVFEYCGQFRDGAPYYPVYRVHHKLSGPMKPTLTQQVKSGLSIMGWLLRYLFFISTTLFFAPFNSLQPHYLLTPVPYICWESFLSDFHSLC